MSELELLLSPYEEHLQKKRQEIAEMARNGAGYDEIVKSLAVSKYYVKKCWPEDVKLSYGPRKTKVDMDWIHRLFGEGKDANQIVRITGYSPRTVTRYQPTELKNPNRVTPHSKPKRTKQAEPGWEQKEFPVHPEVVEAKEALIKAFMADGDWGVPRARLEHLLEKHHPVESRPKEQWDQTRLQNLKKFVMGT